MGKKRIIKKAGASADQGLKERSASKIPKRKIVSGILNLQSTYNNTIITISDEKGNTVMWGSSGSLGFKGTKKSTPFAASKVAELLCEKAKNMGLKSVHVILRGVGSGRESAIRTFISKGIEVLSIQDKTPVPHNGPKPKKPRRV
ncbi:30S ribosomal protein S11 [Patescibacteria group bacterium]|nr:30S ribosomal protein S11 [Patescibacteria group bacterium]